MMMQMFMMLAELSPEDELIKMLRKSLDDYEKEKSIGGGGNSKKNELIFHLHLMILKMKPDELSTPDLMKKYQQHQEWLKLMPKDQ